MREKITSNHSGILVFTTLLCIVGIFFLPPIAQDPHYHHFADGRMWLGIPNFLNVISNFPFIVIGFIGLKKTYDNRSEEFPKEALLCFFSGVVLTGFGSSWYHLHPDNHSLLWDRLPMALTFMSLLSVIVSVHMEYWSGKMILVPMLLIGIASVLYWYYTERTGQGDLRPYIVVQFFPMLMIPLIMLLHPVKGNVKRILIPMLGMYMIAKYFEYADRDLYAFGSIISGHSLKHLFAAGATAVVLRMAEERKPKILDFKS